MPPPPRAPPLSSRAGLRSRMRDPHRVAERAARAARRRAGRSRTRAGRRRSRAPPRRRRGRRRRRRRGTRRRSAAARPPRASSRSRCSGARPASIAKHTRSPGCAGRPQAAKACHATASPHVVGQAAHQRGAPGAAAAAGPGVDQQRRAATLERLEHRAEALIAGRSCSASAATHAPTKPSSSRPRQRRGIGRGEADRRPRAERRGQRGDALVVGVEQRLGLAGRERLDAQRRGRRHQHAVEPVGLRERRPAVGVVVGGVEGRLGLAGAGAGSSRGRRGRASAARGAATARAAAARARGAGGCRSYEPKARNP